MVLPLADDNSDRVNPPVMNYILIALNVFVFLVFQGAGTNDRFTYAWATVPEEIRTGRDIHEPVEVGTDSQGRPVTITLEETPITPYLTLLTSMFMHGGWAHLLGNMLFLWIFGDNLEDRMGPLRYLIFYLLCGVAASLAHVGCTFVFKHNPYIPSLGASGAISGVLGGYILLFPQKRVTVILFRVLTDVPAWVCLGIWFGFQILSGLGAFSGPGSGGDGVAYGAHIGGFIAGFGLVQSFVQSPGGTPESRGERGGPL
jgi:membrane associated rhomboid family serine protease